MKKNGFTLMELLSVIIIIAIVALIAIPIILNTIEKSKQGAFLDSAYGIVKSAEYAYLSMLEKGINEDINFTYQNGNVTSTNNDVELNYTGQKPFNGEVKIYKDGKIALAITNGVYCATKSPDESRITIDMDDEICGLDSEGAPTYDFANLGFDEIKGVNKPVLADNMIPIKWDENNNEIETTENDPAWYDYSAKKWANAKSLDGSYWVWIPRYGYKITSGFSSNTTGTIDVKFLKGRSLEASDGSIVLDRNYEYGVKDTSMHHFLHPAFRFNGDELGFWVAKFEPTAVEGVASGPSSCNSADNVLTKTIKIVPNVTTWRCISTGNAFTLSKNMRKNPVYGWDENNVDTHLIKNTEWGAIAYLSKSIYGADDNEVWNNSFTQYKSGCSGSDVNAYNESVCVEYNTENGVKASTTYNIYGVYDMAGGSRERTAAYIDNSNENLRNYGNALFMEADPKYKNVYVVNATESNQTTYQNSRLIYGDAIFETSNAYTGDYGSWFNDFSYIPRVASPFFIRGSILVPSGGMYGFGFYNGSAYNNDSFRPILFVYE